MIISADTSMCGSPVRRKGTRRRIDTAAQSPALTRVANSCSDDQQDGLNRVVCEGAGPEESEMIGKDLLGALQGTAIVNGMHDVPRARASQCRDANSVCTSRDADSTHVGASVGGHTVAAMDSVNSVHDSAGTVPSQCDLTDARSPANNRANSDAKSAANDVSAGRSALRGGAVDTQHVTGSVVNNGSRATDIAADDRTQTIAMGTADDSGVVSDHATDFVCVSDRTPQCQDRPSMKDEQDVIRLVTVSGSDGQDMQDISESCIASTPTKILESNIDAFHAEPAVGKTTLPLSETVGTSGSTSQRDSEQFDDAAEFTMKNVQELQASDGYDHLSDQDSVISYDEVSVISSDQLSTESSEDEGDDTSPYAGSDIATYRYCRKTAEQFRRVRSTVNSERLCSRHIQGR